MMKDDILYVLSKKNEKIHTILKYFVPSMQLIISNNWMLIHIFRVTCRKIIF
jgi:hypothetical protein